MLEWLKKQKYLIWYTLFFACMVYGIKVFTYNVGIDTDIMIYNNLGNLKHYIGIGRFAVSLTKLLMGTKIVNPFLLNYLAIVILSLAALVWTFVLNLISGKENVLSNCVFVGIFLSHPIMAEQFYFTLQGVEVALSILLVGISVWCIYRFFEKKQWKLLLCGLILMAWGFGTYQSLMVIYIIGCIISIVYMLEKKDKTYGYWLVLILKEIIIFIGGAGIYFLINKVLKYTLKNNTSYIESMFMWSQNTFQDCIKNIGKYIWTVVKGNGTFYNKFYLFLVVCFTVLFAVKLRKQVKDKGIYLLCWLGIFISPFMMSIVVGGGEPVRAQFYLPFMIAVGFYYVTSQIDKHEIYRILCFVCLFGAFQQGIVTSRLFYTDWLRYQEDEQLIEELAYKMGELGYIGANKEQKYIVFVGKYTTRLNNSAEQGAIIGQSRLGGSNEPTGNTPYGIVFFRIYGYDFWVPDEHIKEKALNYSYQMPCWPENGSIDCIDDTIIVKLSNVQ